MVRRRREYNRKGQLKSKQNLLLTFGADFSPQLCYLDLACTRDMTHGCLLPLLPALLRSPFRLRDILTRSSDPPNRNRFVLSGVKSGRHAAYTAQGFQSKTWTRLRGDDKPRVVKDPL